MDISIITHVDGHEYVCLSDLAKEYRKLYFKKLNIAQSVKNIPDKYLIITNGRNGRTYLNKFMIDIFFNSKRNIPSEFVNMFYDYISVKSNHKANNMELFFIDMLGSFLNNMINGIQLEKQKTINERVYDLCIGDKILIEFDESHHNYKSLNDSKKNDIALINKYHLVRVKSNSDYGLELSKIYKKVKEYYL